ncbi:hypothetical protein, partial [Pseudomonas alloputida]|uniref:hypothetical protein n=2 Tax=Pseudomonas TaxID=286 RepID=UPI003A8674BB
FNSLRKTTMKLVSSGRFDDYQQEMSRRIIEEIRRALERTGAPDDLARDLTYDIAFGITSLIDGVSDLSVNAENVNPVLTFSTRENELEFAGGNSWMHEYVAKLIAESFSEAKQ